MKSALYAHTVALHCVSYKDVTGKKKLAIAKTMSFRTCVITDTCKYTCRYVSTTLRALTHECTH